jgi:hypothetical protein
MLSYSAKLEHVYWWQKNIANKNMAVIELICDRLKVPVQPMLLNLAYQYWNFDPDNLLLNNVSKLTALLPQKRTVYWRDVVEKCSIHRDDAKTRYSTTELNRLLTGNSTDNDFAALYPFRTKTDRAIRRTRFADVQLAYKMRHEYNVLRERMSWLSSFDYIACVNLLWQSFLFPGWWTRMFELGCFEGDIEHYDAVCKQVNKYLKKCDCCDFRKEDYIEAYSLLGYRNPPFPGFDLIKEAYSMARSGSEKHEFLSTFKEMCEVLKTPADRVEYVSFVDFVRGATWQSSGSSSIGKVHLTYNGETYKFKARKNMIPDIMDFDELMESIFSLQTQDNVILIKAELGKLRAAFGSPAQMYLLLAWVVYLAGHYYLKWHNNTLEETNFDELKRKEEMLDMLLNRWSLPFDYESYDHQPEKDEMDDINETLFAAAYSNVPQKEDDMFLKVVNKIRELENNQYVVVRKSGDMSSDLRIKQDGGLASGKRTTSLVGNGWNTVISNRAMQICKLICGRIRCDYWVRGDDTLVISDNYSECLTMRLIYSVLNAKGNDAKFSILHEEADFLRQRYTKQGIRCFPCRSLPALTSRKPWNPDPWHVETVMCHVFDAMQTLKRRGADIDRCETAWDAIKTVWSQKHHINKKWLSYPKDLGGLGVEPWDGVSIPQDRIRIQNGLVRGEVIYLGWRAEIIKDTYSEYDLTDSESKQLADEYFRGLLATDDIPALSHEMKKLKASEFPKLRLNIVPSSKYRPEFTKLVHEVEYNVSNLKAMNDLNYYNTRFRCGMFGRHASKEHEWRDLCTIARLRHFKPMFMFKSKYPEFAHDLHSLEVKGIPRNVALDLLFGHVSFGPVNFLSPSARFIMEIALSYILIMIPSYVRLSKHECNYYLSTITSYLGSLLSGSVLHQRLMMV